MITGKTYFNFGHRIVLLVDPDDTGAFLVSEILSKRGIRVIRARNAGEAIRMYLENPSVGCLITELRVPYLDGFDLLNALRRLNPSLPAIALTTYAYQSILPSCFDAGFDDIIFKPINIAQFVRIVQRYLLPSLVMN